MVPPLLLRARFLTSLILLPKFAPGDLKAAKTQARTALFLLASSGQRPLQAFTPPFLNLGWLGSSGKLDGPEMLGKDNGAGRSGQAGPADGGAGLAPANGEEEDGQGPEGLGLRGGWGRVPAGPQRLPGKGCCRGVCEGQSPAVPAPGTVCSPNSEAEPVLQVRGLCLCVCPVEWGMS